MQWSSPARQSHLHGGSNKVLREGGKWGAKRSRKCLASTALSIVGPVAASVWADERGQCSGLSSSPNHLVGVQGQTNAALGNPIFASPTRLVTGVGSAPLTSRWAFWMAPQNGLPTEEVRAKGQEPMKTWISGMKGEHSDVQRLGLCFAVLQYSVEPPQLTHGSAGADSTSLCVTLDTQLDECCRP